MDCVCIYGLKIKNIVYYYMIKGEIIADFLSLFFYSCMIIYSFIATKKAQSYCDSLNFFFWLLFIYVYCCSFWKDTDSESLKIFMKSNIM